MGRGSSLVAFVAATSLVVLAPAPRARACGGFFCSRTPIVQAGERIVYGLEADGTLTMVVEIRYAGSDADFAWILPVPVPPTSVELGSAALLDALDSATAPVFAVTAFRDEGICTGECGCAGCLPPALASPASLADAGPPIDAPARQPTVFPDEPGDVSEVAVLLDRPIGPFEVAVISGGSGGAVLEWLVTHAYDVPAGVGAILDDYVASGHGFVALRLRSDARTRRIRPLVLRLPTSEACLPLRLTAIATTPRLPVTAFFLAAAPVVPRNFSLVEVGRTDPGAWLGTRSWTSVADAALAAHGGPAFAPAFVGAAPRPSLRLPYAAGLGRETDASTFLRGLVDLGYLGDAELFAVLRDHLWTPSADPIEQAQYFNCLIQRSTAECGGPSTLDLGPLAAAIDEEITRPRAAAADLIERHANLTRLYASLRPEDMRVDPIFVEDPGFPARSSVIEGTAVFECAVEGREPTARAEAATRIEVDATAVVTIPAPSCRATDAAPPRVPRGTTGSGPRCICRASRPRAPDASAVALGLGAVLVARARRAWRGRVASGPRSSTRGRPTRGV